ncbi:hypothetical protein L486_04024 [Kwoniella mangroviensis CBS 10435]|uniref:Uncharacterized protein n=1 Tax=Kwoniella mangroviensis CBS 10435 TaxID=1331196 RepID=A0A1B9IR57_9TREE|nr:hypothetical protein L486_04024 [Kwoniella mangroviensis CBS 10435]
MFHTIQFVILARGPPPPLTNEQVQRPPPLNVVDQLPKVIAPTTTVNGLSHNYNYAIFTTTKASKKQFSSLYPSREIDIDEMRFESTSKPTLTPVGFRLLSISERKLSTLDASLYDEGPELLKGVLVKESIKSAWKSVQGGSNIDLRVELDSYSTLGLDVISEESFEEEEVVNGNEERWFEDLVSSFGEDDFQSPQEVTHEWVESNVSEIVFDDMDLEFDSNQFEAFTFPSPTLSPSTIPQVTITGVAEEEEEEGSFSVEIKPSYVHRSGSTIERSSLLDTPILLPISSSTLAPPSPIEPIQSSSDWDESIYLHPQAYQTVHDDYQDIEEFSLPPPLIRSLSSSSTTSIEDEEEEVCGTPPLRYSELNEEPLWLNRLKNEADLIDADESDEYDDEDDELGIQRFTEDEGKVLGGVVGMALGFNEGGFVLV